MPADASTARSPARREPWCLVAGACLLAGVLLWRPIANVRTHTLGPWDWLTATTGHLRPDPPSGCANPLLTDPVRQALPWALLAREDLAHGRLPLWNERNGTGVPLLANYQSALLSPFTWPYYVLGLKLATLASVFARLFCAACFSYLFLRACSFAPVASAFGGVVYTASAGHLFLMLHPHSAVTALLPLVLWSVERLIQAGERGDRRALVRSGAALAVAGGLSGLAGHPEMLLATALIAGLHALVRLAAAKPHGRGPSVLTLLGAGVAAGAIASPQVLPFAEYLRVSLVGTQPSRFLALFDARYLALLVFPNLVGTPVWSSEFALGVVTPNYQEQTTYYVGALPLLLASGSLFLGVLRTRFATFAALALLLAAVVWNVGGLGELLGPFVSLGLIPVGRFYSLWTLAAAVLAAWLVQRLTDGKGGARAALVFGACALAFYAAALWGTAHFVSSYSAERGLDRAAWQAFAARHLVWISASYWVGALAVVALALARSSRARWGAAGVLCGAQLAATAAVVGNYVPITRDELVLPDAPELQALRATVGDERVLFFGDDGIPSDANAILGVRSPAHYDAIGIRDVQVAAAPIFGPQSYAAQAHKATAKGLRLFGVRYVSTRSDWLPIDTLSAQSTGEHVRAPYLRLIGKPLAEDAPSVEVDDVGARQLITVPENNLSGLVVHFRADLEALSTPLSIALRDADDELVARRDFKLDELRLLDDARQECVLTFPPIADSEGLALAVRVRALDAEGPRPELLGVPKGWAKSLALGDAGLGLAEAFARGPEELRSGARDQLPFVVDLMFGAAFIDHGDVGEHSLFELVDAQGRAWIVSGVHAPKDREEAYTAVAFGDFEPYERVLLEEGFEGREPDPELVASLETLHADPQESRWRARVERDAFLVVAQPHYPGWVARLDGREVPLLRANYAFCAVELPAGEHEVELAYEPRSVKLGFALGALGWLALAFAWFKTR